MNVSIVKLKLNADINLIYSSGARRRRSAVERLNASAACSDDRTRLLFLLDTIAFPTLSPFLYRPDREKRINVFSRRRLLANLSFPDEREREPLEWACPVFNQSVDGSRFSVSLLRTLSSKRFGSDLVLFAEAYITSRHGKTASVTSENI